MRRYFPRTVPRTFAIALLTGALGAAFAVDGAAQSASRADAPVQLSISQQPLAEALNEWARVTGRQLIAPQALVQGKTAPAVSGRYTPTQALERLLAGSGLVAGQEGQAIVIRAAVAPGGSSMLAPVTVLGAGGETASGPVNGFVATRSATATKTDTALRETPQSVSVVPREQIVAQAADSLDEALGYTGGVMPLYGGAIRNIGTGFTVRGFNVTGAAPLYLNGTKFPINSLSGAMEPYHFERVELLKGPASILYGQAAPGGIINLVSKRPTAEPLRELEAQVGSWDKKQLAGDFSGSLNEGGTVRYRLNGLARDSKSMVKHMDNDRLSVAGALEWKVTDATTVTFLGSHSKTDSVFDAGKPLEGTLLPNPGGKISRHVNLGEPAVEYFDVKGSTLGYLLEHRLNDTWQVRQNFLWYSYHADNAYTGVQARVLPASPNLVGRYGLTRDDRDKGVSVDNQLLGKLRHGKVEHTVLFGLDWSRNDFSRHQRFGGTAPIDIYTPVYGAQPVFTSEGEGAEESRQLGFYAQDQIKIDDRWIVLLGGRYDKARSEASGADKETSHAFTPRVGLMYLFDNGLAPYYSYSKSFQPTSGATFEGERFKPTRGVQHEVGIKYEPPGVNASVTLAAYQITQRNVLTSDPNQVGFMVQTGEVESKGFELEGRAGLAKEWDLVAAVSTTDAKVKRSNYGDEGSRPASVPRHMASMWVDYRPAELPGVSAGLGVRHVGKQAISGFDVPAYTVFDAALRYRLDNWEFALNVKNLADKTYLAACPGVCYYGDERNVLLTARVNW
jgi:iron complex outermembrane recepter protein